MFGVFFRNRLRYGLSHLVAGGLLRQQRLRHKTKAAVICRQHTSATQVCHRQTVSHLLLHPPHPTHTHANSYFSTETLQPQPSAACCMEPLCMEPLLLASPRGTQAQRWVYIPTPSFPATSCPRATGRVDCGQRHTCCRSCPWRLDRPSWPASAGRTDGPRCGLRPAMTACWRRGTCCSRRPTASCSSRSVPPL